MSMNTGENNQYVVSLIYLKMVVGPFMNEAAAESWIKSNREALGFEDGAYVDVFCPPGHWMPEYERRMKIAGGVPYKPGKKWNKWALATKTQKA